MVAAAAQAGPCGRDALKAVVSEASAKLNEINAANKVRFHEKLQTLKARAGWSREEYVAKATPFVRDERIAAFNARNSELLAKVPGLSPPSRSVASLAGAAPSFDAPSGEDCPMTEKLRTLMDKLVANCRAKWTYMFDKIDRALEKVGGTDSVGQ